MRQKWQKYRITFNDLSWAKYTPTTRTPVKYEDLLGKTAVTFRVNRRTVVMLELQSTTPEGMIWAAQSFIQNA